MGIEQDIKQQKRFSTEFQKLMVNLMYTTNQITYNQAQRLKPYGLTLPQYNVLRILRGQYPEPATVNLIIERMLDKMSNASRIVDKLVTKELVVRHTCPKDRRAVDILISDKGLKLLDKIDLQLAEWDQETAHRITPEEAEQLNGLLDKMRG
ncbi:DNA-binding transcriptional regulator, MarR family [Catalinimonas alkaloidigena]|uniref:DNA-binding transcriptional regulator, MarR family n=1 Tax=Catalinimonas alkaloidigena TaxID=1075417 RepID=A0A1G9LK14_9BACT|nr:MarR family transcriptional regulator [Catalinimonas alkaloidigena]SDL62178.1 DNA-binding transcriptional regulator, MarR family [Catalinimonas alkaloidigena]